MVHCHVLAPPGCPSAKPRLPPKKPPLLQHVVQASLMHEVSIRLSSLLVSLTQMHQLQNMEVGKREKEKLGKWISFHFTGLHHT